MSADDKSTTTGCSAQKRKKSPMKKPLMLCLVLVLLMVSTLPALAQSAAPTVCGVPTRQAKQKYAMAGWITATNPTLQTVTIQVAVGNRLAKPCIGGVVILNATNAILKISGGPTIKFTDLKVGDAVSSNGFLLALNQWTARRISVGASLTSK